MKFDWQSLLWKIVKAIIAAILGGGAFMALGAVGYRSGANVRAVGVQLDPELTRAIIGAVISIAAYWVSNQPWGKWLLSLFPGITGGQLPTLGLTKDQEQTLARTALRTSDIAAACVRAEIVLNRIEEAVARVEAQTKPQVMP